MKKLGKKNYAIIETIEAYDDECGGGDCYSRCRNRSAGKSLNDRLYNVIYYRN
jgi:putative bacteriocin precursor